MKSRQCLLINQTFKSREKQNKRTWKVNVQISFVSDLPYEASDASLPDALQRVLHHRRHFYLLPIWLSPIQKEFSLRELFNYQYISFRSDILGKGHCTPLDSSEIAYTPFLRILSCNFYTDGP